MKRDVNKGKLPMGLDAPNSIDFRIHHCGGCCFLIGEDHYGLGGCPFKFGEVVHCDDEACEKRLDRDKVRHSAAILAQYKRCVYNGDLRPRPEAHEIDEAIDVITRFTNVISKTI